MNFLLTIAIPTYNRAHLLDSCLVRLAHEFKNQNSVEIIISNNASTDNTAEIVSKHQEANFPNLRYLENSSNLGPDLNISQCFREATGKYVWIFSDDDLLLPNYGLSILNLLAEGDWGSVYLKSFWYDELVTPIPVTETFRYEIYQQPLAFIQEVNYWVTFITGNIINKSLLTNQELTYKFNSTNLVQLGWILPAIFIGHPNVVVTTQVLACRSNNTGGYKLFKTFATSFNNVMGQLVAAQAIPLVSRHIINKSLIIKFFPVFIRSNQDSFTNEPILYTLYREYKRYSEFWIYLMPIYFKSIGRGILNRIKTI